MRLLALLLLGAATTACGLSEGVPARPATSSPATAAPATPSPGEVLGTASSTAGLTAVVSTAPGAELQETVTVPGPLTVLGGCVHSLTAWAETLGGVAVPTPRASPRAECLAIALLPIPAGGSRTFTATLPEPPVPGSYLVAASLLTEGRAATVPPVSITT